MVKGVEHHHQVHGRAGNVVLDVADLKGNVLQPEPFRVRSCATDGGLAVIHASKSDIRETPGELAGNFARATAQVHRRGYSREMMLRQIGESANGEIPGIGTAERIVLLRIEQPIVKLAITLAGPAGKKPTRPPHWSRQMLPDSGLQ